MRNDVIEISSVNAKVATSRCVSCGKPAVTYGGHVIAKMRMALGNMVDKIVLAGWCSKECKERHEYEPTKKDFLNVQSIGPGYYGLYDGNLMGPVEYMGGELFVRPHR